MTYIIAHRGASRYAPENTMPAFARAVQMGADGIETDVHLSKDGIPVLIHDESLNRTTSGKGLVKEYTVHELKKLDAGSWFSSHFKHTPIITLEEFLRWVKPYPVLINLELKTNVINYEQIEQRVCQLIESYNMTERTILSSFNPASLSRVKEIQPAIQTAFLTSQKIKHIISFLHDIHADALHVKYRIVNKDMIDMLRDENIPVRVYTVNRTSRLTRCFKWGCDGVVTDVPDLAHRIRQSYVSWKLF